MNYSDELKLGWTSRVRSEKNCNYDSKKLKSVRTAIRKISEAIKQLKELDTEYYMEDEISSVSLQLSLLEDKIDEDIEKEWNEISR